MKGGTKLALFATIFVALTVAGVAWSLRRADLGWDDVGRLGKLPIGSIAALAACCGAIYAIDIARYRAFGHAIGEQVTWRAAIDASIANFLFSWITPGAALGAPAAIAMLGRRGVSWEGATVIAFGKSLTGTAVLIAFAFVALASGRGPEMHGGMLAAFTSGAGIVAAMLLVPILGGIWPAGAARAIDRACAWLGRRRIFTGPRGVKIVTKINGGFRGAIERIAKLRTGGAIVPLVILGLHVAYVGVLVAIGAILACGFGATGPIGSIVGIATVFAAFNYVAPTPGGAGLSEAAGAVFFGSVLDAGDAAIVVLLFRALTFYLQIVVGAGYMVVVGGAQKIAAKSP